MLLKQTQLKLDIKNIKETKCVLVRVRIVVSGSPDLPVVIMMTVMCVFILNEVISTSNAMITRPKGHKENVTHYINLGIMPNPVQY